MMTTQKKSRFMLRTFIFFGGFFISLLIAGCEREEFIQTQPEVVQLTAQTPRALGSVKELESAELKIDEETRAQFETRIREYKTRLRAADRVGPIEKSSGTIIVPDPDAGIYTIQDGVDAAWPGSEVKVQSGAYSGDIVIATPDIEVKAEGAVTLNGSFTVIADAVKVKGFEMIYSGFATIIGMGVTGLEIDGNTVSGGAVIGIALNASKDCTVKGNEVSGVWYGIILLARFGYDGESTTGNTIKDNSLTGNFSAGIQLQNDSRDNTVKDNESHNNVSPDGFGDGIRLVAGPTKNVIKNNVCNSNGFSGINVIFGSNGNIVKNNVCKYNNWFGIDLYDVTDNKIGPDNELTENTYAGIQVEDSDENTIAGNTCDANTFTGVAVVYGSNQNEVRGNSCSLNGIFGIDLFLATGNTIGSGNEANDNGSKGIRLASNTSDNRVFGNVALNNDNCDIVNEWGATGNTEADNDAYCIEGF